MRTPSHIADPATEILGATRGRDELKAASLAKAKEVTGRNDFTEHEANAVCLALCAEGLAASVLLARSHTKPPYPGGDRPVQAIRARFGFPPV